MTERPPTPPSPTAAPSIATVPLAGDLEDRTLATTSQLAAVLEDALEVRLDESLLETILLELDRRGYVEWVSTGPGGAYVWDLTESPERIADAVATAIVAGVRDWLEE